MGLLTFGLNVTLDPETPNSAAFKDFENNGYPQLPALMADLKKMVRSYTRLWAEIRDDPGRFFLGDRSKGFQP